MTDYTRVTIQGEGRKADLVLPDDEPIAAVLPEVLSLLDETTERSARPVVLMTTVGEQLSPALTLAEQDVEHGTILRLVRVDEAPPPPEVADVTDLMGEAVLTRSDAWKPVWGTAAAAGVAAVAAFLGGAAAVAGGFSTAELAGGLAALLLLSTVAARRGRTGPAVVLVAAVVGGLSAVVENALSAVGLPHAGATALIWFGLACVAIGLVSAIGFRDAPLTLGAGIGSVLVLAWCLMFLAGVQSLHAAAWVAVASVVLLGLLPGIAMTASGLTGLDDTVVEGERVARPAVIGAVDATHRALTWATVAAVVPMTFASWLLARNEEPAAQGLAAAVAVIALMRTQVLPLAPQRLTLITASAVPLLTLAVTGLLTAGTAAIAALALVVVLVALVAVRLSENTKARLRRFAGIVEMIAVIALLPLLLWLLGVFADLVSTFVS